jgi:hypothetical protein
VRSDDQLEGLSPYYRALVLTAERDFDAARVAIRDHLAECRNAGAWEDVSSVLQMLGDVEVGCGNRAAFEQRYEESIAVSPDPYGARLFYAHALLFCANDVAAALQQLTRLESELAKVPSRGARGRLPPDFFERAIETLRDEATSESAPSPKAFESLLLSIPPPDD